MPIAERIAQVQAKVRAAAERAERDAGMVTVMAVSKTFPVASIREAYLAGARVFGENRVQEFAEKSAELKDLQDAEWHLIGHLQTNKAAKATELFSGIDSVDSLKLAEKLNASAAKLNRPLRILIEIKTGTEPAKTGLAPTAPELEQMLRSAPKWGSLRISGLMTIPPYTENPALARPYFRQLCELRDRIANRGLPGVSMDVLSMGMSHDFEVAIEEGSTCIRVGTAIFGMRDTH
jgi:pyridoxal phosphate enzyme (YggS family)